MERHLELFIFEMHCSVSDFCLFTQENSAIKLNVTLCLVLVCASSNKESSEFG